MLNDITIEILTSDVVLQKRTLGSALQASLCETRFDCSRTVSCTAPIQFKARPV